MKPFSIQGEKVRVAVIGLGGTILGESYAGGPQGYSPTVEVLDFFDGLPQAREWANLSVVSARQVASSELTLADAFEVVSMARKALDAGADAITVLTGTDTLEEFAFALDLLWDLDASIVVTGSMRTPDMEGADGPANVMAAIKVAIAPESQGRGCLVVLNDQVHAARYVQKRHASLPSAFDSPLAGPIGVIVEDRVVYLSTTPRTPALTDVDVELVQPVALLTFAMGDAGRMLGFVVEAGFAGLVVEGSGGGSVSPEWGKHMGKVAKSLPVVYSSRTRSGATLERTYGGAGGEIDLIDQGVIPAGLLDGLKSRILLSLLLASGCETSDIPTKFAAVARSAQLPAAEAASC